MRDLTKTLAPEHLAVKARLSMALLRELRVFSLLTKVRPGQALRRRWAMARLTRLALGDRREMWAAKKWTSLLWRSSENRFPQSSADTESYRWSYLGLRMLADKLVEILREEVRS